ncbi:MAG: IMP dehydrogenase [Candidatus Marinimicrobia bacterium]|nr:IMP dehydrogenase [Candidatus Neomarinimicrobiota bacterium]
MTDKIEYEALTFDDVLLIPAHSKVLPRDVNLNTQLTKKLALSAPLVSAAMDTVTGSKMAIEMAIIGGIGILHRNQAIKEQSEAVDRVKRAESTIIQDPVTISLNSNVGDALKLLKLRSISGFPVVEDGFIRGIVTHRDIWNVTDFSTPISEVMTSGDKLITAPYDTSFEDALKILADNRIEKLPLVNDAEKLTGLLTVKDIEKSRKFPDASKDSKGRLRVGAAIGVAKDSLDRAEQLINSQVDVLVIDSAHGHSEGVLKLVEKIKSLYPEQEIIAGNVVTEEGTAALIKSGADAVKVGIGPGASCTTRVVTGVGMPQLTAVMNCYKAAKDHNIPIIADGGIRYSGDIAKALASGASSVMMGSVLAGMEESPGEMILLDGRWFKTYRGMGSIGAMQKGGSDRYFQEDEESSKLVPEGIEGRVPYRGHVRDSVHQFLGGVRAAMGYCGAPDIESFRNNAKFSRVTSSGIRESHPHDLIISREAPNYQSSGQV